MQVHQHTGRPSRYCGASHNCSHNCSFDSASAVEVGIGGLEQFGRLVMVIAQCGGSPGECGCIASRNSSHQGVNLTQPDALQDNGEFITSGPEHDVGSAEAFSDAVNQGNEDPAPFAVPKGVIDAFEAIEVDRHHQQLGSQSTGPGHGAGEHHVESTPVTHTGERVEQ